MLFRYTRVVAVAILLWLVAFYAFQISLNERIASYVPAQLSEMNELSQWKMFLFEQLGYDYNSFRVMAAIAGCESSWRQFRRDGSLLVSKGNQGIFQINKLAHKKEYERLGLDVSDPFDNIKFAVLLYKRNGIEPWRKWSGHCFLPKVKRFL